MPGISRDNDTAAGGLVPTFQNSLTSHKVYANGELVIVHGDQVDPHGNSPHNNANIIAVSSNVFVGGKLVANAGDNATCDTNHKATGSDNVIVGDPLV